MQLCVCERLCVCVSLPDLYLLVLSFILEVLYLWTLFSQTLTLSLSHLLPGFAAPFSLTSRSVSTFKRVFIRLSVQLKLRSYSRLHIQLHDCKRKDQRLG